MTPNLGRARSLRRAMTETERFVWTRLRGRRFVEFKFRRQVPLGSYIVDFVCFEQRLILEFDGGQHNEVDARRYDERRTKWLESQGFRVVRFWNHDVLQDWETVAEVIWQRLHDCGVAERIAPSPPAPLPRGERGGRGRSDANGGGFP